MLSRKNRVFFQDPPPKKREEEARSAVKEKTRSAITEKAPLHSGQNWISVAERGFRTPSCHFR